LDERATFAVAFFGLSGRERAVLQSVLRLSAHRSPAYVLSSMTPESPAQILIVDADDDRAFVTWQRLPIHGRNSCLVPSIMVTSNKNFSAAYALHRPLAAIRILHTLDTVVREKYRDQEQRVIGGTTEASPTTTENDDSASTSRQITASQEPNSLYRALVVDDSLVVRKQIDLELTLAGITTDLVETGEQALDLLGTNLYDLIFLDVVLPGVDGYQLCKAIKRNKETKQVPIIMLTSKSSPFDRVRGTLAGCEAYLTKPIDQASFQKIVQRYLQSVVPS
jgi:two-component system cell cycle response regulator